MLERIKKYMERETTIKLLERMSNRELDDLGIQRGNIRDFVRTNSTK